MNGHVGHVDRLVDRLLPAVRGQALAEVALWVEEAHADERQAQVAGLLGVVAGQNAQAAGVDRQRAVQAELEGEVGDGFVLQFGIGAVEPAMAVGHGPVEVQQHFVEAAQEGRIGGARRQRLVADQAQYFDRVVLGAPPQGKVEAAKDITSVGVPAPPDVKGQLRQSPELFGHAFGEFVHDVPHAPWASVGWSQGVLRLECVVERSTMPGAHYSIE